MARPGHIDAQGPVDHGQHKLVPALIAALIAPGDDHRVAGTGNPAQPVIVSWPDWILGSLKLSGPGCAPGKQIDHRDASKAPVPGKANHPAQGGIIAAGVGA